MKSREQIKDEIIRKYEELVKSFGNCNCDICEKANSELASLKSRLAEEKEEDVYTKSLRLLTEFMDKTPSEEIAVELRKIANKAGEEKELISTGRDCVSCFYGYITRFDEEPCSSCDRDIYSNWQPR